MQETSMVRAGARGGRPARGGRAAASDNGGGGGAASRRRASRSSIGASLPLTGDFSEPGKAAQQGYKVWQEMVNDKGGLLGRKVQIVDQGRRVATRTRSSPTTTR